MSEMIERVAIAMAEKADGKNPLRMWEYWEDMSEAVKSVYRNRALIAIETMRNPTAEMLDAGPPEPYMDAEVWAKMIDGAL